MLTINLYFSIKTISNLSIILMDYLILLTNSSIIILIIILRSETKKDKSLNLMDSVLKLVGYLITR